jgi:small subunit ribosomal protein S6
MDTTSRFYETTFIVNASLDDAQVDAVINRVQDTITKNGGTIESLNKWGRKRLAYPINKKTNGFYVHIEFTAPGTANSQLERSYKLDEMILRHLTVYLDRKALKARETALRQPAEHQDAPPVTPREPLLAEESKDSQQTNAG